MVELRKRQLIDEGCYEENSIDEELYGYFYGCDLKRQFGYDNILLVGINYDKDSKEHECVIENYRST